MKVSFAVGQETLTGEVTGLNTAPQILILHGAGKATKERAQPLAAAIAQQTGQSIFAFDFSGHGESSGELKQSSLAKRVAEANAARQFIAPDKPVTVMGFSMGGHIALELLAHHDIQNLVLFYPGIYPRAAYVLPFDERFSHEIRKENSWQNASVLDNLKAFKGNLLIVWGDQDAIIPRGVVDAIYNSASNAQTRELFVISGGTHSLLPTIYADPQLMDEVVGKVAGIISP